VSIHTGPQLKGSLLRYLSTVRVPRPFKESFFTGQDIPFIGGSRGNVFGKQSKYVFAEFLIKGWEGVRDRGLFRGGGKGKEINTYFYIEF